jgi:hypothetical protein
MSQTINSYKDLLQEKARLSLLLSDQKKLLRQDIDEIKQELAPVKKVMSFAGKLATRDYSNWFLTMASDTAIDIFLKRSLLSKAGWFTRVVIPFIAKNLSSHVVADNKNKLVRKLFSWIGKKNANGKMHPAKPVMSDHFPEEEED